MGAKKTQLAHEIHDLTKSIRKIRDPVLRKLLIHTITAFGLYYTERERDRESKGKGKTKRTVPPKTP